jgi:cysteine synthase
MTKIETINDTLSPERKKLYRNLERLIGHTRLVEMENALPNGNTLFIKMEIENEVGGSHYDRVYLNLFREKEKLGIIKPGDNIFETTSGTAGISFANLGRILGYKCHVAIPAGGEKSRETAIINTGSQIYLTPEKDYVNGFKKFIISFSRQNPDFVFINHSMGNIYGKGTCINEIAISSIYPVVDEIMNELSQKETEPDYFLSALGNGTNTLGIARRLRQLEAKTEVVAYEMLTSGVGFSKKYGTNIYKKLLDESMRFNAKDFERHNMPGTSFPGIECKAIEEAMQIVKEVRLVADEKTTRIYTDTTKNKLPNGIVKVKFGVSNFGRSTEAGIALAQEMAKVEKNKTFIVIAYDKADRYDRK